MKATKDPVIETSKKSRGRPQIFSDETRRSQIVGCARDIFLELGYAGLTTDRVAARCRISKNTLYRLFPSKRDLLNAVIGTIRRSALDLPRPEGEDLSVEEALGKIFFIDIDEETEHDRKAIVQSFFSESIHYPEVFEVLRESAEEMRRDLAAWFAEQQKLGKLQIDHPLNGARMLTDMIFGAFGLPQKRALDWPSRAARRDYMCACIAFFVRATRPTRQE